MKHRYSALIPAICAILLIASLTACGNNKEPSTLTGMVVSVDGSVVTLREIDLENVGKRSGEDSGDFDPGNFDPGSFDPSNFDPSNFDFSNFDPKNFGGELPSDFDKENFRPEEGYTGERPSLPDGANIPERPDNGETPDFGQRASEGETVTVDLADAHISIEGSDGEKATGTTDDIKQGSFLTVTLDRKGNATNVTVSSFSGFGGFGGGMPNFGGSRGEKSGD
ncbi:MAG: hypothetical protein IK118_02375 [Clostridia bacterium]|nr:hypothetical protein [Clostridia bacterium]